MTDYTPEWAICTVCKREHLDTERSACQSCLQAAVRALSPTRPLTYEDSVSALRQSVHEAAEAIADRLRPLGQSIADALAVAARQLQ